MAHLEWINLLKMEIFHSCLYAYKRVYTFHIYIHFHWPLSADVNVVHLPPLGFFAGLADLICVPKSLGIFFLWISLKIHKWSEHFAYSNSNKPQNSSILAWYQQQDW